LSTLQKEFVHKKPSNLNWIWLFLLFLLEELLKWSGEPEDIGIPALDSPATPLLSKVSKVGFV